MFGRTELREVIDMKQYITLAAHSILKRRHSLSRKNDVIGCRLDSVGRASLSDRAACPILRLPAPLRRDSPTHRNDE